MIRAAWARSPLALALLGFGVVVTLATLALRGWLSVDRNADRRLRTVVSVWKGGNRVARRVATGELGAVLAAEGSAEGATRVFEDVLDEGPVLALSPLIFGLSFVPERDGVKVSFRGRDAYATPDDLIDARAYEAERALGPLSFRIGVDPERVASLLATELGADRDVLLREGKFARVPMRRRVPGKPPQRDDLSIPTLRASVHAAGEYLARVVQPDGTFRYEIDAMSGEDLPGYNWPRHSGATLFLAEAAAHSQDRSMRRAVRRAAARLVQHATMQCGEHVCIAEGDEAKLGSSALALIAYAELVENGIEPRLQDQVAGIARFIRSMQRPDGEFMHFYDRKRSRPVDRQVQYYTGEAALGLSRAHRITRDPADLDAARRALDYLVDKPALFVGARYYWAAEHWTCQALADLWDRAPNPRALQFCLDWQEWIRNTMIDGRESAPEYDGAATRGPFLTPRLTLSASRMEAGVATLSTALAAGTSAREVERLEAGIQRTLRFMLRYQLLPGPAHLMANPDLVHGAFAGGLVDIRVRIDEPQHAGAALLRYLRLLERRAEKR